MLNVHNTHVKVEAFTHVIYSPASTAPARRRLGPESLLDSGIGRSRNRWIRNPSANTRKLIITRPTMRASGAAARGDRLCRCCHPCDSSATPARARWFKATSRPQAPTHHNIDAARKQHPRTTQLKRFFSLVQPASDLVGSDRSASARAGATNASKHSTSRTVLHDTLACRQQQTSRSTNAHAARHQSMPSQRTHHQQHACGHGSVAQHLAKLLMVGLAMPRAQAFQLYKYSGTK